MQRRVHFVAMKSLPRFSQPHMSHHSSILSLTAMAVFPPRLCSLAWQCLAIPPWQIMIGPGMRGVKTRICQLKSSGIRKARWNSQKQDELKEPLDLKEV